VQGSLTGPGNIRGNDEMRITHQMLNQMALDGMQANLQRLADVQKQAVTGKQVTRPEDDPYAVEQSLGFRARIEAGESSLNTINMSLDWLNSTDDALSDTATLLNRAQALALRGASESLGTEERAALATEVEGMLEQAIAIGNTRHGDDYIFSGFQVDSSPFDVTRDPVTDLITSTTYNGDSGLIKRQAEPGTDVAINVLGDPLFSDIYDSLIQLRDALQATSFVADDVTAAGTDLKTQMDNVLDMQAAIGTKSRRLETTASRIEASQISLKEMLSNAEDADMAEVVSQLTQQQFVYETALAVNANVLRLSLLDFLK
jgi:flagellar hook-associated protein 3 FlgL